MESNPLLGNPQPRNGEVIYRIKRVGHIRKRFPTNYPEVFRGVIPVQEYIDSINQINNVEHISAKFYFLFIIPPLLFFLFPVFVPIFGRFSSLYIAFIILVLVGIIAIIKRERKKARKRLEVVIDTINFQFRLCGARFTYIKVSRIGLRWIDIRLFNPVSVQNNSSEAWVPRSYSSINDNSTSFIPNYGTQQNLCELQQYHSPMLYSPIPSAPPPPPPNTSNEPPPVKQSNEPTMFTIVK